MIPWRLKFYGIRDYPGTEMDLSGKDAHVLITGPNGTGKSTITYCMGAVLYSSKVDVEGLRSRNLPSDQTWKAAVSLLFKNDGQMKIDAPDYVEFCMKIVQEPGQPMKKEFVISTGDEIDQWIENIKYTSGDRQYNFTSYKKDLQYKYKIDPDLFYLIWYQQEVNQFAVMHPEERFRIFSEMHSIDRVQRDWEESMESMKETQETLRLAEQNVNLKKFQMTLKQSELNRYLDNQRRLVEGGERSTRSLLQLEVYYKQQREHLQRTIEQLQGELEDKKDELADLQGQQEESAQALSSVSHELQQLEQDMEAREERIQVQKRELLDLKSNIDMLEQELEEVTKARERIIRTEEEVRSALDKLTEDIQARHIKEQQLQSSLTQNNNAWQEKVILIAELEQMIKSDEASDTVHRERLRQYISSHHVQERMNLLDQGIEQAKDQKRAWLHQSNELKDELVRLEEERDLSARQLESMRYFDARQIKAYPLRDLIEMDETSKLKDEQSFQALKYTIFFDGIMAKAPNDLYHVPLRKMVPDRSVTELPQLRLRVKEGLHEQVIPHAIKALWWVEQFYNNGSFRIEQGTLVDPMGIRGPQEKERYILSAQALKARKAEVQQTLLELSEKLASMEDIIVQDSKSLQGLNSIIQSVRESEAFMTHEHERTGRKTRLNEERVSIEALSSAIKELEKQKDSMTYERVNQEQLEKVLRDEAAFYEKLGQLKERYEELNAKRKQYDGMNQMLKELERELEYCTEQESELEKTRRNHEKKLQHVVESLEDAERKLHTLESQIKRYQDDLDETAGQLLQSIRELEDMKQLIPDIYNQVAGAEDWTDAKLPSLSKMRGELESGRIQFQQARAEDGIDPAAEENFKVVKEEYERLENEYKRTSILLDEDMQRTDKLKNQLETTINMRVLEIQQRFKSYMGHFQFEGEIDWEYHEDRRGRTHFNLFIKARKEGHRGTLEDVSVKARGGRVGKGVSGGEESLSSLLFALALLQNLQTAPGFIVLDEFDSALDEHRKHKVFDLYARELQRKLIILTPKSHEESYMQRFEKAFIVQHDPTVPRSRVVGIVKKG